MTVFQTRQIYDLALLTTDMNYIQSSIDSDEFITIFFNSRSVQKRPFTRKDLRKTRRERQQLRYSILQNNDVNTQQLLSFDVFFPSFSFALSPPCDLQITAYK